MKLFSIPLDILKVMEASSKPKFGCKNANDFSIMFIVIPQMFNKWETDQCYSALWEFLFYAQFVKFDNLITTEIHDWNKEWVNDNVRFRDWLDHMESQQCQWDKDKGHNPKIGQTDSITTTQSCYQIYTQTIKNICNINFIFRSL